MSEDELPQPQALEACESLHPGASLASVHSVEENAFLHDLADSIHPSWYDGYLLGGSDAQTEGVWTWSDGSDWDFEAWGEHDPEGGRKRNCMYVTNIYRYIHWSDAGCEDFPMKYICGF